MTYEEWNCINAEVAQEMKTLLQKYADATVEYLQENPPLHVARNAKIPVQVEVAATWEPGTYSPATMEVKHVSLDFTLSVNSYG